MCPTKGLFRLIRFFRTLQLYQEPVAGSDARHRSPAGARAMPIDRVGWWHEWLLGAAVEVVRTIGQRFDHPWLEVFDDRLAGVGQCRLGIGGELVQKTPRWFEVGPDGRRLTGNADSLIDLTACRQCVRVGIG